MDHSKLSQRQILFLYAFLRQIDRSLNKSRWSSVKDLRDYYKDRITPEQMINYLQIHSTVEVNKFKQTTPSSPDITFKDKLRIFFQRNHLLSAKELADLYNLLVLFDQHLKSDSIYTTETEMLRISIAEFYSRVLSPKISVRKLRKLVYTEHYMQNRLARPFKIMTVVPKDFYEINYIMGTV